MLKPKEAALVLAKINAHHGNMQLDRLSVQTFHKSCAVTRRSRNAWRP